ncbi:MAG: tRNA (N(6)-L-threonylcarbamoyladenosine(37)-C(2))-methylthiotransferase MtaB [Clostridia bacterium]|nr:tRNA (N(6)-L-threonylcarbamoyladenosine(37)-C(2))-methylthiotransferase MtaB [Clostridia bacterium]
MNIKDLNIKNQNATKKVAFLTLGCKVNSYETNGMIQNFISNGYEVVGFNSYADVYVINTCTVTNMSDRKSRKFIREPKRINPRAIVVACGCYVQVAKEKLENIEDIDLTIGNNEKKDIVQIVENYMTTKNKLVDIDNVLYSDEYCEFGNVTYTEKTRAVIKIQDGCDRFCTYCIIPFARGKIRSRRPENIISEIEKIAQNGIKEVVITGIHVASYGKDFKNNYGLIDILEEINKIKGIERIRLGSLEPLIIDEAFLKRLVKLEKVCHHFHLSLQSGCDETLKRMNRRYTTEEFLKVTKLLRENYLDVILTTDIIVGFPGETNEEFERTRKFLEEVKFYKMHVFKYSQRNGTKAAVMPNQVSGEEKDKRSKILLEMSDELEKEYLKQYIGKEIEVLFEEKIGEYVVGHTANYLMSIYKTDENIENKIVKLKVIDIKDLQLVCVT